MTQIYLEETPKLKDSMDRYLQAEMGLKEIIAKVGPTSHPVAVYTAAEQKALACLGVTPTSVGSDGWSVVVVLPASELAIYVDSMFGIDALPAFEATESVELKRLEIFTDEWEGQHGNPLDEALERSPPCCDEEGSLLMGEITSTGANSFEISTDEGNRTVYVSVCSRIFQIGVARNRIVLRAVAFAENLYISSAIIYE